MGSFFCFSLCYSTVEIEINAIHKMILCDIRMALACL